jgi:hypothetical protein
VPFPRDPPVIALLRGAQPLRFDQDRAHALSRLRLRALEHGDRPTLGL